MTALTIFLISLVFYGGTLLSTVIYIMTESIIPGIITILCYLGSVVWTIYLGSLVVSAIIGG